MRRKIKKRKTLLSVDHNTARDIIMYLNSLKRRGGLGESTIDTEARRAGILAKMIEKEMNKPTK